MYKYMSWILSWLLDAKIKPKFEVLWEKMDKIARLQVQGGVIALESTALVVVSDRGVGRIKSYRGTELDVFDPKARAHASHHGLSWQVFSRNGKGRFGALSEKPWEFYRQTMDFNPWICDRLEKRREKGLPTPTDYNQHQAATKIQAPFVCPEKLSHQLNHRKSLSSSEARIRGYLVRQWTLEVLGGGPRDHSI